MDKSNPNPAATLSCEVCLKEIPRTAALTAEGTDYVGQYCGLECYQEFLKQPEASAEAAKEE